MSLGLVCHFLEWNSSKKEYHNSLNEKTVHLTHLPKYSQDKLQDLFLSNILNLKNIVKKIISIGFKSYRLSSGLIPVHDKVDRNLWDNEKTKKHLIEIGDIVKQNNIRITMHPDHFVSLTSDNNDVIKNSMNELSYHAWILDSMGLDESAFYALNIHGAKRNSADKLIDNIKKLPDNVRKRLTLENDEKSYNIKELYKVYQETKTPICFDSHHHTFNDAGLSVDEATEFCIETWGDIKPLQHLSNTEPEFKNTNFQQERKHSDFIETFPAKQFELLKENKIDVDIEAKMKNIAIFDLTRKFNISL
jgi:UV DNA damage endonuclease